MEKYCHFIAITHCSPLQYFFVWGIFYFFHFQNVCFLYLPNPVCHPLDLWPASSLATSGPREGEGVVRKYAALFLCWGVFSWGGVRGEDLSSPLFTVRLGL